MTVAWQMSATALLEGFSAGSLSPVDAMTSVLERVDEVNPALNALFVIRADEALEAARRSEARWLAKAPQGALDGVPVTIKDSIAVAGWPYWRGTQGRVGTTSDKDSPPAARLKEAGAIIFAKTTMPDYGLLPSGVSSAHGTTKNPWNLSLNTGGSSSGAGAAIASGMGPISIGSDLAGSVRLPAAHCGIFALKPSQGLVPHTPYSSTRVAGPLTRTVADAALALSVLSRRDPGDVPAGCSIPSTISKPDIAGMRVGLLLGQGFGDVVDEKVAELVRIAAELFRKAGASLADMADPVRPALLHHLKTVFSVKAGIERDQLPEASRALTLPFISSFCDQGDAVRAKDYLQALEGIASAKSDYRDAFADFDFVLSPVMPTVSFPADDLGASSQTPMHHLSFTAITNQLGWPAASIFCGFTPDGLPVGLQITGREGTDLGVLALAAWYEQVRGFEAGFPMVH